MKAGIVTKVKSRTIKQTYINNTDGFQDNTPIAGLNTSSSLQAELFIQKSKPVPCVKSKYISPQILTRILQRKGYRCLSAPLLARGKYIVMVENERGRYHVLTVNARSGVIVKRRFLMRKIASQPMSLFDYIT